MMVYQYLTRRRSSYGIRHIFDAFQRVEVQATDDIGLSKQFIRKLFIAVVQKNVLTARHPLEEIGKRVRHNYVHCLFLRIQEMI